MKYKLDDIVTINNDSIKRDYFNAIDYLDTSSVFENRFEQPVHFKTSKEAPSRAKRLTRAGDTVISTVRPNMHHLGFIDEKLTNNVFSTGFAVVQPNIDLIDPYYLFLFLSSDVVTKKLQSIGENSTSTYPSIKPSDIKKLIIDLPELKKQRSIAKRMKVLEDKVKLNTQINDNLETIRTVIFNRLFANKMLNQKNGKIKQIASLSTGKRPKRKHDYSSPNHNIPIVGASKVMGYTSSVLYDNYIITTGRVGTHGIIQRYKEPIWVSDNSFVFMSDHQDYLYEILKNFVDYSSLNRGSTQPLITQTDLKNVDIYIPSESEFDNFENLTKYITESQFNLRIENVKLDNLKRMLLENYFV